MSDDPAERLRRLTDALDQEAAVPEYGLWWLSFIDPAKSAPYEEQVPGGPGFLGAVVVQAGGFMEAVTRASMLGLNPGGEVTGWGPFPLEKIGPEWRNRLLTHEEVKAIPARE